MGVCSAHKEFRLHVTSRRADWNACPVNSTALPGAIEEMSLFYPTTFYNANTNQSLLLAQSFWSVAKFRNARRVWIWVAVRSPPLEQIKLALIASGLFGRVYASFNDFAGHGYHGVSVMRSYLGFDAQPRQVTGLVRRYDLAEHWSRLGDKTAPRPEIQEHGLVDFADGRVGVFHWTNVGYDSPLRWWRSSRFLAEKGMGITVGVGLEVQERLSPLAPGGEAPRFITLERRWERVDGGALIAMVAHTGDPDLPIVRWENPFRPVRQGHGPQWHDDEIGVAGCLLSLVQAVRGGTAPSYGAQQARLDQEVILAIRYSSARGGVPVALPMSPEVQDAAENL